MSDAAPWEDYKPAAAPAAANDVGPWNDYKPQRAGFAEENLAGPTELIAGTVANIPHAAAHAAVDIYRRLTGGDTNAPDPAAVQAINVPMGRGGQQLAGDITSLLNPPADSNSVDAQIQAIRDKAVGPQNATVADVLHQTGQVAGDVAALAPVVGGATSLVRKIAGTASGAAGAGGEVAAAAKPTTSPAAPIADIPGSSAPLKFDEAPKPISVTEPSSAPTNELPPDVQSQRVQTLKDVGLTEARASAVAGDAKGAATDFQQSKLDTDGGKIMSDAIGKEREKLGNFSDDLVAKSGGSTGLDETSLHNRGSTIVQPLQDLSDHLDSRITDLYKEADTRAAGKPVDLDSFNRVLNDDSNITNSDRMHLRSGLNSYVKQLKLVDTDGSVSGDVAQAETVRKYLNEHWSPQNSKLVGKLKDAIDDDVTKSAGEDVYSQARAIRTLRAQTLDDPKGVASLLDSSGPSGINRAVNVEKIPDAVARMPVDQFGHVVDTLKNVPTEVQPQAQAALNEIRSQFMLRMQEQAQKFKGNQWNNRGVTQYLNANSAKLAKVFSPSELQRIKTLNDAGNILDIDRSYPGAAVQGHNLLVRGAIKGLEHGGEALGASIGGAPGAVAGGIVGKMASKGLEGTAAKRAAMARIQKL